MREPSRTNNVGKTSGIASNANLEDLGRFRGPFQISPRRRAHSLGSRLLAHLRIQ